MSNLDSVTLPEALQRRPEARAYKVEDLLYEVQRGRVRIPPFQRGFRWERKDAEHLIDSIYRGYPVGTLLFWETKSEAGEESFGSIHISAESRSDALWVVDGQQRVVSLARVLLAEESTGDEFALFFDLEQLRFLPPPSMPERENDPSRWLPMNEVIDSERMMQWLLDNTGGDDRDRRERAIQLGKRIRDYEISAYLVRTENEKILREVFGRINHSGKKLKESEVFDALHGLRQHTKPGNTKEISNILDVLKFGHLEEDKVLYRLLLVIQGHDVITEARKSQFRLDQNEAAKAYSDTENAARHAIQFIKKDAGIPHYDLLPYKQPLVALGKFFHHHPEPSPRSRELLSRWVWRGALSGSHRGDTVSTRNTMERIDPYDEEGSVQLLLKQVERKVILHPDIEHPFKFNWAESKLQILAMMTLQPRNINTGNVVKLDELFSDSDSESRLQIPQIFKSQQNSILSRSVVNRWFHPKIGDVRSHLLDVDDLLILKSHGISGEAINALRDGNDKLFFEIRSMVLKDVFKSFFDKMTRQNESDRPSLSGLIVEDDG